MTTVLNPYLSFRSSARQAMDLYHSVFGGELERSTFGESGMSDDPAEQDLIMHSQLKTDGGFVLMAADTPKSMELVEGSSVAVSLSGDDESELRRYWDGVSAGGAVTVPLEPAPWGDTFGMCVDQFGVTWMVNIAGSSS